MCRMYTGLLLMTNWPGYRPNLTPTHLTKLGPKVVRIEKEEEKKTMSQERGLANKNHSIPTAKTEATDQLQLIYSTCIACCDWSSP